MNMVLRRAASPHAEGSPTSPGWPGHRAALQHLQGSCSKSFLGAGQSHPAALPSLATKGARRGASCPPVSPSRGQRCCNKSFAAPFPQEGEAQSHANRFYGLPCCKWAIPTGIPIAILFATLSVISNAIPSTFPSSISTGMAIAIHFATPSALLTDSHCNSRCNFHSDSHCNSPCISQCTALLTVTPFAIPTAIPSSTPGLALLVHH